MDGIGILGGTFDPFHYGHLSIAKAAMEEFNLKKVILLPTKVQPFKIGRQITDKEHRLKMAEIVASENNGFVVSALEADNNKVSYTYNTLTMLKKEFPNDKIYFIMGTDSFFSLESWYKGKELLRDFAFIIGTRSGYDRSITVEKMKLYQAEYGADINLLNNEVLNISSTEIKNRIKDEKSIGDLVPEKIEEYIHEHRLYK